MASSSCQIHESGPRPPNRQSVHELYKYNTVVELMHAHIAFQSIMTFAFKLFHNNIKIVINLFSNFVALRRYFFIATFLLINLVILSGILHIYRAMVCTLAVVCDYGSLVIRGR